jgi:hypothetical protein
MSLTRKTTDLCTIKAFASEGEMKNIMLDDEEKELLESYERGEWQPAADKIQEVDKLKAYAQNTQGTTHDPTRSLHC